MKRVLAFLLCVMTLVTALPLTSFAAYENTHTNTGNQIEDLISVATTQIGYTEGNTSSQTGGTSGGSGNYTKYGKWYGINPGAWCAMFVSWCANQAGISSSIVPKHASCDIGMQWFQNNGKWKWSKALGGSYTPKRGDIIYFRTNTSITYDSTHVGIVYAADSSTVYTIEGNTSNKCARKSYSTSSAYILGYGTPAYTGGNTTPVTKTYTITMDPNGGSMVSNKTYQANYGETYTKIFGSFPMATRSGYVLTGWLCEKYSFTLTDSNMGNYYAVYENTTFKAVWEKGSTDDTPVAEGFTITFDPNGGTLTSGNKTYSINTGDYYKDVIGTMPTATRSGYTFTGWYCEKYGYTLSLGASEYFAVAENVTFKAQWEANAVTTYSLSFNANGGSLSSGSSSYSITSGQTYKAALGSSMPTATRSGYTFNGWYCSAIGLTLTTSNWSNTFTANTNLTFVAQWTQNAATKYTITFDPNGGSITSGNKIYQIENGQTYTSAIGTLPVATRSGYTFNGWYCEKYNFTLNANNMGNYYAVTENTTFKAQWVSNNAVTLTLNAGPCGNGATKSISLTSKTLYHDKSSIYSNYGLLPSGGSSDQRVFMGWYTGYDAKTGRGTGTMYWDTYSGSGNETLYAIWGYPIVFNADGGTYKDGSQRYISYVANYAPWNGASDATDPMSRYIYMIPDLFDNAPVKGSLEREMAPSYALVTSGGDIYTMEGPDQNLTVPPTGGAMPWSAFRCTSTVYGTAIEFVAIWKPTVTYNANGGSGSMAVDTLEPDLSANLYTYENYSVRGCTFTKSGASFEGWNTKADGTGTHYSAGQVINTLSSSDPITLYAQWSDGTSVEQGSYTITLDGNGTSYSKTYTIKDGQKYTAVIGSTMPKPTKTNAVFNGWYNADYDFWLLDGSSATFNVCKNITFYAQWEEYESFSDPGSGSYKLTFDPNGGTMKTAKTFTINVGQTYLDAIGGFPFATKFGYTLDYWLLEEYGFGLTRTNLAGNYMVAEAAGNYTFKAQWTYIHDHTCSYKDARITVQPSCTQAGSKLQACLCGNTKTVSLAKSAHSYTVDWGTTEASCMSNAKQIKKCANCEATSTTEISGTKLSHSYGPWIDQGNGKSVRSCIYDCGTTETKNNVYNITYLDQYGAQFSGTLNSSTKYTHTYGTTTTLYNPTRTGYTFGGWYLTSDCSGTKVTSLGATAYTNDITLYALWTSNGYSITYYRSDATTTAVTASWMPEGYPTSHIYGYDTVLPTNVNRPGWTFNGWYTKTTYTDANKVEVLDGTAYTAAIKLYAYFTPNTYSITYYDEGGKPFSGTHASGQYTEFVYNTAYTLKKATKTGYTFAGWYTDPACTVSIGTALAKNTYNYDLSLYCKWTPISSTISYRVINSTTGFGSTYMPAGYPTTHTYDTDTSLVYPTRTGYTFNGWYSNKAGTTPIEVIDATAYPTATTIYIYGQWIANTYNIEYYDEGGAPFSGENAASLLSEFSYATKYTLTKGTKTGYTFAGWYTDPECTKSIGTTLAASTYPNDIKLYCKWTANSYNITYYRGTSTTKMTGTTYFPDGYPATHTYDTTTILPTNVVYGTRYFLGFYTDKAYTNRITEIGPKDITANLALYSKWETEADHVCTGDVTDGTYTLTERIEPTCHSVGKETYTCYCNNSTGSQEIPYVYVELPMTDHSYVDHAGKAASCTESGWNAYKTCKNCDYTTYTVIAAKGHSYSAERIDPTCTEAGYTVYICINCSDSYVADQTPANGHGYTSVTTEPTCTADGKTVYTCTECGDSYSVPISANGHSYTATVTAPTCTDEGYTTYTCSACGNSYVENVIAATGHNYITNITPPSCTESGKITYSCKECGYEVSLPTAAKGHKYEATVTLPTCDTAGYTTYTCSACRDSYTADEIPAFGHNYSSSVEKDATCITEGIMLHICSRCNDSYSETIPCSDHSYKTAVSAPTCTGKGYTTYTCKVCGDSYRADETEAKGHTWGVWTEVLAPTYDEEGLEERECTICSAAETRTIPVKELVTGTPVVKGVNNYTVTIEGMIGVREVKFAIGHYTTGSEVRNAEGCITLSETLVNKNSTEDGIFKYEVTKAGSYTFWVRMHDGGEFFVYADITEINTYLTAYGVILTVNDFKDGYKDLWIAKGDFSTYNEIKYSTDFKYQAAAAKLDTLFVTHDFTYTCPEPGVHTVLIRYADGSYEVHHIDLTVDVPTFYENGLQVTVGNIPDIKIIRTAYGIYNSVAEIKVAAGVRNFNNKSVIKDAESYKIQYREEGWVTLIVEYNNGYKHIHHYYVQQKTPTFTQEGNTVIFGNLEGLNVLRYAKGTYTSSSDIKSAAGSKALKPDSISNGKITVTLTKGTYTFCVQYDDESYNFYVVDIA